MDKVRERGTRKRYRLENTDDNVGGKADKSVLILRDGGCG